MSYSVKTIPRFDKDIKGLVKKYPSLKQEYINLVQSLKLNPTQGNLIGNNAYKICLAIASKNKGKSGGARVITYLQIVNKTVYLLSIFDKADQENSSDKDLEALLKLIP